MLHCHLSPQRELQPIAPHEEPWKHSGIDLISDMRANSLGLHHILVVVWHLTKFLVARALKIKTSREVLDNQQYIYLTFSVPQVIQHDQGPKFTNKAILNIKFLMQTISQLTIQQI